MTSSETFARAFEAPARTISRRRVLQVLAASVVAVPVMGFSEVGLVPASSAIESSAPPVAYDDIVGLL